MNHRILGVAVMLAFAITIGCSETVEQAKPTKPKKAKTYTVTGGPQIGAEAPEIVGVDLDGVEFKLSDYRGKVVMLDFYGDW